VILLCSPGTGGGPEGDDASRGPAEAGGDRGRLRLLRPADPGDGGVFPGRRTLQRLLTGERIRRQGRRRAGETVELSPYCDT